MQDRKHYTVQVTPSTKVYATLQLLAGRPKKSITSALNAVSTLLVAGTSQSYYITGIEPSSTIEEGRGLLVNFVNLSARTPRIEKRFFPSSQFKSNPSVAITEEPLSPAVYRQVQEAEKRADTQVRLDVIKLREGQEQKRASLKAAARQAEQKKRPALASVKEEPAKEKILSEAEKRKLEADREAEEYETARELFNELKARGKANAARKEQARVEQLQQAQQQRAQEKNHREQKRNEIQAKTVEVGKLFDTDFTTDHFSQACQTRSKELQMAEKEINDMLAAHKKAKETFFTATEYDPHELSHRLKQKEIKKLEQAIDKTKQEMLATISVRDQALFALEEKTSSALQQASAQTPSVPDLLRGAVQAAIDEYCQSVLVNKEKQTGFLTLFKKSYPQNKQNKESGLGITLFSNDSSGHIQLDPALEDVALPQWQEKIDGVFSRTKERFSQHELLKDFPAILRKHIQKNLGNPAIENPFIGAYKLVLEKAVIEKNAVKILQKKVIVAQRVQATQQMAALSHESHLDTALLKEQLLSYKDILQREQDNLREIVGYRQEVAKKQTKITALLEEAAAAQQRVHLMTGAKSESLPEAKTIAETLVSIRKSNEEITRIATNLKSFDVSLKIAGSEAEKVELLLQAAEKQMQEVQSAVQVVPAKQLAQAQAELYALVKAVLVEQIPFWNQQTIISGHKAAPAAERSKKMIMPTGIGKMIDDINNMDNYPPSEAQTALATLAKTAIARTSFKSSLFSPTRTKATNQLYSIIKECSAENLADVNKVKLLTAGLKTLQDYQKPHKPQAKNDRVGRLKKTR